MKARNLLPSLRACSRPPNAESRYVIVRRVLYTSLLALVIALWAAPAYAYYTESTSTVITDCAFCHGIGAPTSADPSGPHGGYTTTTNKCATCHSVHAAGENSVLLLPAATVKGTCETCHDGTAGKGVYGAVAARGESVASAHEVDVTNAIPGGDPASGAETTATFNGTGGYLTCTDCHSAHGSDLVDAFTGDRARVSTSTTITSARLLKRTPTSASGPVDAYGSDWCGACHKGRLSGSGVMGNHPVDSRVTTDAPFEYESVARVTGANSGSTELGTLGRSNFGYVMPDPRTPQQGEHYPLCQQCHEDARTIGDVNPQQVDSTELYSVTATYATSAVGDNPEFQVFPHESQNEFFLVETADDLCLNCHSPD
jgi:hypothetical protein